MSNRKTAAERRTEQEALRALEEAVEWETFTKTYTDRFARVMFEFLSKPRGRFRVVKSENPEAYRFQSWQDWAEEFELPTTLPKVYDSKIVMALETAESALNRAEMDEAEEQRKLQVRAAALSKLNEEERKLLGL